MQTYPFVCGFILIFSLLFGHLLYNQQLTVFNKQTYVGQLSAHRDALAKCEAKLHENYKKIADGEDFEASKSTIKPVGKYKKGKPYKTPRTPTSESSKLNLTPLPNADTQMYQRLRETIERLIIDLYGHTPFYAEYNSYSRKLEKDLLKDFLQYCAQNDPPQSLSQITLPSDKLQQPWYLMLRGTPDYDVKEKKGWPPLSDFVTLSPTTPRKALCFKQTSIPILNAFFGPDITQEILTAEQNKYTAMHEQNIRTWSLLDEEELCNLLRGTKLSSDVGEILKCIQFSGARGAIYNVRIKDKKSHIVAKKQLIPQQESDKPQEIAKDP